MRRGSLVRGLRRVLPAMYFQKRGDATRRFFYPTCLFVLFSLALCGMGHALTVTLVQSADVDGAPAILDEKAIVLTFGDERVVIHDTSTPVEGERLSSEELPLSELYLIRDRRAMSLRTGYDRLYSHHGFLLGVVKDPEGLAAMPHVSMRPVTASTVVTEKPKRVGAAKDPIVTKMLKMVSATQYKKYMNSLAANLATRYACSNRQAMAMNVIKNFFSGLGLETSIMTFQNDCGYGCQELTGYNVIGIKKGTVRSDEYYLVGGHYDSINEKGNPCTNARGANDNASGAAGLMELARVFSKVKTKASVIFVAFSGEEEGFYGSKKYVQTLVKSGMNAKLKGFVILDMISYYKKNYGVIIEGTRKTTNQSAALDKLASYCEIYTGLTYEVSTDYGDSDHEPFLDKKMPGALLIEMDWDSYAYYHTGQDRMGYQKIAYGVEVVRLAAALLTEAGVSFPKFGARAISNGH